MRLNRIKAVAGAAAAALLVVTALAGCSSDSDDSGSGGGGKWAKSSGTLVFGTVPDKAGSDSNWKPLEDYIAKKTGYKVEFYPTADYTALIAAAVAGKVDVAAFSGLTYVQATNKGAELNVASSVIASKGLTDPGYYSEAIVPAGSSITTLAGAKGKKVCFVDPNSTSGFLFGLLALQKAGLNVKSSGQDASGAPKFDDFTATFAGSHDKSVQAVGAKQCDVGFAEDSEAEPAAKKGTLKVIGKEYVPGGPLVYSKNLPQDAQDKIKPVLSSITLDQITAAGVDATEAFQEGFQAAKPETDDYYKSIRDICEQIPAAKCAPTS
ncbi:phosphate/phosphite/phosphonate ABC transporter substrate-binding protein [Cryptosporangium phraense]|uniref:Phosphate/phosphite/phosphonate ABC transporter substrate-binding protein n=1 Tax=Cryptosporangium phraense TaxID=2593070 RepID=A0A545AMV4_9ACTN|nr:phosphate/phosphite/phosphonate ABC transporter substrate-binding protein [Cryptosporangium phraense]TQS42075.1 phosphate/phosphite/phosphonate ABC transporter substrate-binding protein [Cryptosporangium phraense]